MSSVVKEEEVKKEEKDAAVTESGMLIHCSDDVETEDPKQEKTPYYLGAHVSSAGGVFNAVENASLLGATAFALFLKSQRQWAMKPIADDVVEKFKANMKKYNIQPNHVLPHGSYLCNIGTPDTSLFEKAQSSLLEECKRVEKLGLMYLNIHPGSTTRKCTKEESIKRIASAINYIHSQTSYMTIVLENTAGGGGTIGVDFKELKSIIDAVEKKDRIGVCIDTCHAFASGIDLTKKNGVEKMVKDFDEVIGLKYLKAMHLNDSTGGLGSNRDVHKPIGEGQLGLDAFRQIMNCDALRGIPLILETPWGQDEYGPNHGWAKEIKLLQSYVGVKEIETKKTGIAKLFDKKKPVKEEKTKDEKKETISKKEKVEQKGTQKSNSSKKAWYVC